jgi:hypothetical protein
MPPIRRPRALTLLAALVLATLAPSAGQASAKIPLPADVRPSLARAADDEERLRGDGCLAFEPTTTPKTCVYGNRTGSTVIALVGDSHASMLFPAVEAVAKARGWKLLTFVKVSCPFTRQPVFNHALGRTYTECATFVGNTIAKLKSIRPDLVVTTAARWMVSGGSASQDPGVQGKGIGAALAELPGKKAVLIDAPYSWVDVPGCLAAHRDDVRECSIPRWRTVAGGSPAREKSAAKRAGATLVDLMGSYCNATMCPVAASKIIRYRDQHHLTQTFARTLGVPLGPRLAAALG